MSKKNHFVNSKHKHQPIKLFAFRSIFRIFCVCLLLFLNMQRIKIIKTQATTNRNKQLNIIVET